MNNLVVNVTVVTCFHVILQYICVKMRMKCRESSRVPNQKKFFPLFLLHFPSNNIPVH